ncbi:unnamed protein product [Scytosiphon promiscuus]
MAAPRTAPKPRKPRFRLPVVTPSPSSSSSSSSSASSASTATPRQSRGPSGSTVDSASTPAASCAGGSGSSARRPPVPVTPGTPSTRLSPTKLFTPSPVAAVAGDRTGSGRAAPSKREQRVEEGRERNGEAQKRPRVVESA